MASASVYLNFSGNTEEAFLYYKKVFGGDFLDGISRFGDIPPSPEMPPMSEAEKNMVMHVALEIYPSYKLMGTDAPESMGFVVNKGNNVYICLNTDSREQTDVLFSQLAEGGQIEQELQDMFWGAYYGSCTDKFGIKWMLNFENQQ